MKNLNFPHYYKSSSRSDGEGVSFDRGLQFELQGVIAVDVKSSQNIFNFLFI